MIRIDRRAEVPAVLLDKGKRKRRAHSLSYTHDQAKYDTGERTFAFDAEIYGHETVKFSLKEMQHGKCAFCESKVDHIAYGDVEHFRPKGGFRQSLSDPLGRPGYYWLAYEWENLLFACQLCNQRFKKNLFPLQDPSKRAHDHRGSLSEESPMIIDPTNEDPQDAIGFRGEVAFGWDAAGRGEATLEALGLNRIELQEHRRDWLKTVKLLFDVLQVAAGRPEDVELKQLAEAAQRKIEEATVNTAEYAGMIRAAIASEFNYLGD